MSQNATSCGKLFALLVGIDDYDETITFDSEGHKVRFPKLYGCMADAGKMEQYFSRERYPDAFIKVLTNSQATKENIVDAFLEHLGRAGKEDTALFYYSGHGTRELADCSLFNTETDGKLESLVCHYSNNSDDFLLADKELRWLIRRLSIKGTHVVTIFDCCHSGDMTRNARLIRETYGDAIEKRVPFLFPQRDYNKFIFSATVTMDELRSAGEYAALPEGKHIQLAACEADESAIEIGGEGVFTKVLLRILNHCGGDITYGSLGSRIRQYMRGIYEQKPKIYFAQEMSADRYQLFLNTAADKSRQDIGEITYNEDLGWQLNRGVIHGIRKGQELTTYLNEATGNVFKATVRAVHVDHADILFNVPPNQEVVIYASIPLFKGECLALYVDLQEVAMTDRKAVYEQLLARQDILQLTTEENDAQYCLRHIKGMYYLSLPGTAFYPLTKPVPVTAATAAFDIIEQLGHVHEWESVKNLSRLTPELLPAPLEVLFDINGRGLCPADNGNVLIDYLSAGSRLTGTLQVSLENRYNRNIYVACIYLLSNFASFTHLLTPQVKMLIPEEKVNLALNGNMVFRFQPDRVMEYYNRPQMTDYLLFITSTTDFDVSLLQLDKLPGPPLPGRAKHLMSDGDDVTKERHLTDIHYDGWRTDLVSLTFCNPAYNRISSVILNEMMSDPDTAVFAEKIFSDLR